MLTDTRILLGAWNPSLSVVENVARFRQENPFGKSSDSRLSDILPIFRRRYLSDPERARALALLRRSLSDPEPLTQVLYFHTVCADALLKALVVEELYPRYQAGRRDLPIDEVIAMVQRWSDEGRTTMHWGKETVARVAQGALATLRDFGLLSGAVNKSLNPPPLTLVAFAFLVKELYTQGQSAAQVLQHTDWRVFFLETNAVERLMIQADQAGLLRYAAAGGIVRLDFPATSLSEYALFLSEGHRW